MLSPLRRVIRIVGNDLVFSPPSITEGPDPGICCDVGLVECHPFDGEATNL